jgi:hypothetical protein
VLPCNTSSASPQDQLAAAINCAHDRAQASARSAIEAAIECGRLLLEAKAPVAHGEWLPWIEANLSFGGRQARKYMRVAANAQQLANRNCGSDLGINAALELLADHGAEPRSDHEPGSCDWGDLQLEGPFNAWDVIEGNADWLTMKLLRYAKLPAVAVVCLQAQGEHGFPILRLVPADELYAAIEALAPIAKGERVPPFDHASLNPYGGYRLWQALKVMAERGLGQLIAELLPRHDRR